MTLGPLTFLAPWALLGLLSLPVIWWLLQVTPPQPRRQSFPPLELLRKVKEDDETPDRTPLWLLLMRMGLIALISIALAKPVLNATAEPSDSQNMILIVDDGWTSAPSWNQIVREARIRLERTDRNDRQAALVFTASGSGEVQLEFQSPRELIDRLNSHEPVPWRPDRARLTQVLGAAPMGTDIIWLSDGLAASETPADRAALDAAGVTILSPPAGELPLIARTAGLAQDGLTLSLEQVAGAPRTGSLSALDRSGQILARQEFTSPGPGSQDITLELPSELRNRVAMIRVDGQSAAGSTYIFDDSWSRPQVGIVAAADDNRQQLLTENHYIEQALAPYADIQTEELERLLTMNLDIIVMSDSARSELPELTEYVESGGLLVRFAGPRLAGRTDDLIPVSLRRGDRSIGGALAWSEPQSLENFDTGSPFFGLDIRDDIKVRQQVMAEPGGATDRATWARLTDGSPVVTSATRGQGRIILFHVPANPGWSDLPLSGLFVDMLRRTFPYARANSTPPAGKGAWSPELMLGASGRWQAPSPDAEALTTEEFETVGVSSAHPPGLYRRGAVRKALNTVSADEQFLPLGSVLPGVTTAGFDSREARSLTGWLLLAAGILLALDGLLSLILSGRRLLPGRRSAAALLAIGFAVFALPDGAIAQEIDEAEAATTLRFAYIITGDAETDRRSEAGLRGMSWALTMQTTVEPAPPVGVNPETDTLVFYPLIYWPVGRDTPTPSAEAAANLNGYMAAGGTLIIDTQDAGDRSFTSGAHPGLERISRTVDIPPLIAVSEDHVLTKSFFLMQEFPGRFTGQVWVENIQGENTRDGVSSVIISGNDWASAWAVDENDRPMTYMEQVDYQQQDYAFRFAVNAAMYVLTGNYKADQVHVPELLKRLGADTEEQP